jgi:hypothetical protein|nr:MAG TPA: hypothetical protein [Caudoviricetes sp.]
MPFAGIRRRNIYQASREEAVVIPGGENNVFRAKS